jgi:hypothetical protein
MVELSDNLQQKISQFGKFISISTLSKALQTDMMFSVDDNGYSFSISASAFTYTKLFPLPLTITGQVACFLTKLIRFSPPRGTIKSTFCVGFLEKLAFLFGHNSYSTQE